VFLDSLIIILLFKNAMNYYSLIHKARLEYHSLPIKKIHRGSDTLPDDDDVDDDDIIAKIYWMLCAWHYSK